MHKHKYMNTNTNTKAQIRNYKRPQFKEWDRMAGHLISGSPTINQNQNGQPVKKKLNVVAYFTGRQCPEEKKAKLASEIFSH